MQAALLTIIGFAVAAAALFVAGIYMLAGLPWALIASGVALSAAAITLRSGLTPNG